MALWQGVSHLSTVDRTILGNGDDASKTRVKLDDLSKQVDAIARKLAVGQASQNGQPTTKADIDRKAEELKPKVSSAIMSKTCVGKHDGEICAEIQGVGKGYCASGMCANFSSR